MAGAYGVHVTENLGTASRTTNCDSDVSDASHTAQEGDGKYIFFSFFLYQTGLKFLYAGKEYGDKPRTRAQVEFSLCRERVSCQCYFYYRRRVDRFSDAAGISRTKLTASRNKKLTVTTLKESGSTREE